MKLWFLGSAESIHAYRWVRFFADRGHEVRWFSLVPSSFDDLARIRFEVVGGGGILPLRLARAVLRIRRLARDERPDLLHAHYVGSYGLIGLWSGIRPFVATAWGSDVLFAGRSLLKRPFVARVLRGADVLTCDADHMVRAIKAFGVAEERVHIVLFATDTERFSPGPRDSALRERLGIGDAPAVISIRSLEPVYDVETLIRAAPLVRREVPDVRFVVAGGGSEAARLRDLATSLGVAETVVFAGKLPNPELPAYFRSMDAYVSTSLSDAGLASSTAEAMACAVPVVITDSGENRQWVEDGVTGSVVPVRDPERLAAAVVAFLRDPARRRALGDAGRSVICERNNLQREMAKMEALYSSVASGH